MQFITDLHIHSHYSIATSKKLVPEYLEYWARLKGINVLGTGDCIHPGWMNELRQKLEPTPNGLYRLKKEHRLAESKALDHPQINKEVYFVLTGEISSIYKKNEKVRKVHNLTIFPSFEVAEIVQSRLDRIGNITSDGRPILGLDSKTLLEMVLESSDLSFLVPAHIWTPWFSVLGSKSGFNNLEECYEDLTPHIFAVETGLSSDPAMNWTCSFLDKFKLISNSDAHSPEKLGREANLFQTELSYQGIYQALKGDQGFIGTIEFFPEEGKYHYDGHRKCQVSLDPLETIKNNGLCPVCHQPVTKGVMYRVAELSDRSINEKTDPKNNFYSITQLPDILAEIWQIKNSRSKKITSEYLSLINCLGSEFNLLLFSDLEEIKKIGGELLTEAIKRLRAKKIIIKEGFDGEFGQIKLFTDQEVNSFYGNSLFSSKKIKSFDSTPKSSVKFNLLEFKKILKEKSTGKSTSGTASFNSAQKTEMRTKTGKKSISGTQKKAIEYNQGPCLVVAGPGSGKTRVLIERISYLLETKKRRPEEILAITFSNKAAEEIRNRIIDKKIKTTPNIFTFHALGLSILKESCQEFDRQKDFYIIGQAEKKEILKDLVPTSKINKIIKQIEAHKQGKMVPEMASTPRRDFSVPEMETITKYNQILAKKNAFDLDDLLYYPVTLLENNPTKAKFYRKKYRSLLIDEYQDINGIQYRLLRILADKKDSDLFVIGDPDQAIYQFRGSDLKYLDLLRQDYPSLKIIELKKSFRCPTPILKAGQQILQKMKSNPLTGLDLKLKINIQKNSTAKSEADWIATQIEKMIGGVRSFSLDSGITDGQNKSLGFSDFAILCRSSFMFTELEIACQNHGISYQIVGSTPFYEESPYQEILLALQSLYNRTSLEDLDPKTEFTLPHKGVSFVKNDRSLDELPFNSTLKQMISEKKPLIEPLNFLMEKNNFTPTQTKKMNELTKKFGTNYELFFRQIKLRQGVDDYQPNYEAVTLMTLHASKGLEFKNVFIPGCEKGLIPFELFGYKTKKELAEEERLFYVGITRAKENLYLSYAQKRYYKGRQLIGLKSPLLNRIEEKLLLKSTRKAKKNLPEEKQLDLFSNTKTTKD